MENFSADVIFSSGENNFLPDVDVWLVIDVLRATTLITRWFELGGPNLFPIKSPDEARAAAKNFRENGADVLLMGEINGLRPEGFDLGNSPLDLRGEILREKSCGVMSTTNGTVALNEAALSGSTVIAASFRNFEACLDYALTVGKRIGFFCSGRKKRPSWEDILCAGAMIENLQTRGETFLTDSAKIALTLWQVRGENLLQCVMKSTHAQYLEQIGFGNDIAFACEMNASGVVPILEKDSDGKIFLKRIAGNPEPRNEIKPGILREIEKPQEPQKKSEEKSVDPFEELLTYTKKPAQYFFIGKKEK